MCRLNCQITTPIYTQRLDLISAIELSLRQVERFLWCRHKERSFLVTPLRQRMLEDLQIRHYSPTTIRIYLHVIAEFARHFSKPPDQLDAEHIRCYQLFLIKEKRVSQSTYIQTVCDTRFSLMRKS